MIENLATIWKDGFGGLLSLLSLGEVLDCLDIHQGEYLLDEVTTATFVNRIASAGPELAASPRALAALARLLGKYLQLAPFSQAAIQGALRFRDDERLRSRLGVLNRDGIASENLERLRELAIRERLDQARKGFLALLDRAPRSLAAAAGLLDVDYRQGLTPEPWLDRFTCPQKAQRDWDMLLFKHHAAMNRVKEALALAERLPVETLDETARNLAAECLLQAGDAARALDLYRSSLALDPAQPPVRRRMGEIESPTRIIPGIADARRIVINIYTFDKARYLEGVLKSLRKTGMGGASLRILVNGCTDDSLAVAESAKALFPENNVAVIDLPVNIGAPAARNWLIRQALDQGFDYAAFLDDDVEVAPGWLDVFTSILESDPKNAVVAAKTLFPGAPPRFQYLYRNPLVIKEDIVRLTLHAPQAFDNGLYDVVRPVASVMGCQHMFRTEALRKIPLFDIRYAPSQVDDIDHDLLLRYQGYRVVYCGLTACVHHQRTGTAASRKSAGNTMGNDIKFSFKHRDHLDALRSIQAEVKKDAGQEVSHA